MAERTLPGAGLTGFWDYGQDGWNAGMDANLLRLSVHAWPVVEDMVATLPTTPAERAMYIMTAGPDAGKIAARDAGAWQYVPVYPGMRAWVVAAGGIFSWTGSEWISDQLPSLVTAVENLGSSVDAISGQLSDVASAAGAASDAVATLQADVGAVSGELETATQSIASLTADLGTVSGQVESLITVVSGFDDRLDAVETTAANALSETETLGTQMGQLNAEVNDLGDEVVQIGTGLSTAQTGISGLEADVLTLREDYDDLYRVSTITAGRQLTNDDMEGGKVIRVEAEDPVQLTVPFSLDGRPLTVWQGGEGQVEFVATAQVNIHSVDGKMKTRVANSTASLMPLGGGAFLLVGDLA